MNEEKPNYEELLQRYLKGDTTRSEERKLLDYYLKGWNELLIELKDIKDRLKYDKLHRRFG